MAWTAGCVGALVGESHAAVFLYTDNVSALGCVSVRDKVNTVCR